MLQKLDIHNLAIAHDVHVAFSDGLNVITGETGAGKSILVRAISAVLGGKLTSDFISADADSLRLDASFTLPRSGPLRDMLGDLVADDDTALVTAREVDRSGRHKYRINGRLVPLSTLRLVGEHLVDVHGQHEPQSLLVRDNHIQLLDAFLGSDVATDRQLFAAQLSELRAARRQLELMQTSQTEREQENAYLQFASEELEQAHLKPGEDTLLLAEQRLLDNVHELQQQLGEASVSLTGGESEGSEGLIRQVGHLQHAIDALCSIDPRLSDVVGLLDGAQTSLKEAESALSDYLGRLELDDGRLAEVTGRLDTIARLEEKYHRNLEGLIDYRADIDRRLHEWQQQAGDEGGLRRHIEELETNLSRLGASLTARRREGAPILARRVEEQLSVLAMPNARFVCSIEQSVDDQGIAVGDERFKASETGLDVVEFLIAPNPGEGLRPLREIASGGELSRIMLALKTVFAENDAIPTMVFDEVDAGIGGETGLAVAAKLASLGAYRQVIVVTHLPTIAARAKTHLVISKDQAMESTAVAVHEVTGDERVRELARMVSGDRASEAALANARELLFP
ncbi:MAG: DNA repair protein RecN [Candidatus Cryosericum sp.]|nr:DNA repair protein RecN [bacterium]